MASRLVTLFRYVCSLLQHYVDLDTVPYRISAEEVVAADKIVSFLSAPCLRVLPLVLACWILLGPSLGGGE